MPHLIDIEVPADSTFLMVRRDDGSLTLSIDPRAAVDAVKLYLNSETAVSRAVECAPQLVPMH